jgi:RNA polymerase sigma-70 factor (ECF subfamily)
MTSSGTPPGPSDRGPSGTARADGDVLGRRARARLAELFDRYESQVFGFLVSRTGDRALAEDLTTETFLALARRAATEPGAMEDLDTSTLVTIARRRLIDHWRSVSARQRRLALVRVETSSSASDRGPGGDIDDADLRVLAALDSLPERQRAALTLRHLDEMAVSEVAEVLGTTYRATESILSRARRAFRTAYEEGGDER